MPLGPRVGGAHVDVNLNFDDSSLDTVGRRIHQQLAQIGQQNRETYRAIGRSGVVAFRSMLGSILAGGPLIGSALSAAIGNVTLLAGALYSLGQTSFATLPILTSLGLAGITLGIGMRNFAAAVSETDPKALQELLKGMPKSMQEAVLSTRKLSDELRAVVWPRLFAGVAEGIDSLRNTGVVKRGLGAMADSLNYLVRSLLDYAGTKKGLSTIDTFLQNNAKVFKALSQAAVPFLDGFLRLVNALTPAALRLAGRITDLAKSFSDTTQAEGYGKRIDDMMKRAEKTAGLLLKVFGNLGSALANVFGASNHASNNFLRVLVGITGRFKHFTESAKGKNSIAEWAQNSVKVFKAFKNTIDAVRDVLVKLADSRIIISFLQTVEGAFRILGKLPYDKMIDAFVKVSDAIRPLSSFLLAVAVGGAAFNIFLGSLGAQVGGLVADLGTLKSFGNPFKGLGGASAGKHAAEIGKIGRALEGIGSILGKTLKFAGLAGLVVWIVTLIAKSKMLQDKVKEAFQAFKDLWEPLKTAFSEISKSLKPVGHDLKPVFDLLDKIATLAIGLVLDTIIYAFKSLGKVIKGAGRIISGVLDFFHALFHLDGSGMLDAIKKIASGVIPLLEGLFGLFVTFFAPAKLARLGGLAFKGLFDGIRGAFPGILSGVGGLLVRLLKFFITLQPKLFLFGGKAMISLAKAIARHAPEVLARAGRLVGGVIKWIAKLPGRLILLGRHAITVLGDGMKNATPGVLSLVGKLLSAILRGIAKLPELLFKLGVWALKRLGRSIREGISGLKDASGKIFSAIWNEIKDLPGQMLAIGKGIVGGIINGITEKIGDLKDKIGEVAGVVGKFWPGSPVKEGPLKAWNYGGGATGGGRNVIDALAGGLQDISPIRKAMAGVASAVSDALVPTTGSRTVGTSRPRVETGPVVESASGGNVYIGTMMPHNYGEFDRQMRENKRLVAIGGRRVRK